MYRDGEVDIRGAYCVVVVVYLINVIILDLFEGIVEWIVKCQIYEGGFFGEFGLEVYGGYIFCGYVVFVLLGKYELIDNKKLF